MLGPGDEAALPRAPGLDEKIAYLRLASSYPDGSARVELVETHMSCVFLTERHAYKLKKPIHNGIIDLSTLAARHGNCLEEVRLNRRLAREIYLGVVPLALDRAGKLALDGAGAAVDWLVKMQRLPRDRMLDALVAHGSVRREDVERFMRVLARFYAGTAPAALEPTTYCARFVDAIETRRAQLLEADCGLDADLVDDTARRALRFARDNAEALRERVRCGRVLEGHGDLRPEHVCLLDDPVFIDCLEFDRDLRIVDTADEIGYLALECVHLGDRNTAQAILDAYVGQTGDDPPHVLVRFYQACRALLRARLSAWHLRDMLPAPARQRWLARAADYLALAAECMGAGPPRRARR
jgi:aminoglycoside phosphotransferase family enzyme